MVTRIPSGVGLGEQRVELRQVAEHRLDVPRVGDVVAVVGHRRGVEGRDPQGVDAQVGQVGQPAADAGQVADAVAVPVGEAADVDLVEDRVAPPVGGRGQDGVSGSGRTGLLMGSCRSGRCGGEVAAVVGEAVLHAERRHLQVAPERGVLLGGELQGVDGRRACAAATRPARPCRSRTARAASAAAGGRAPGSTSSDRPSTARGSRAAGSRRRPSRPAGTAARAPDRCGHRRRSGRPGAAKTGAPPTSS